MTTSNSTIDAESRSENVPVAQQADRELLWLVDRILAIEGQRIRLLRELIERQSHRPDNQTLPVYFHL